MDFEIPPSSRLRIVVLAGGDSAEREVSLRSGSAVADALRSAGHRVRPVDPAEIQLADLDRAQLDVCFIALHGGAGEDGTIQQELDRLGIPYTGSRPDACRLAMSKSASKRRLSEVGVATLPFICVSKQTPLKQVEEGVESLGYPLVVKPDSQGSSVGVGLADCASDLAPRLAEALRYDDMAIIEPYVRGREFTVAVLDEVALPLVEIISAERVFSYDAKYRSSLTEYLLDFGLSQSARSRLQDAGLAAARALDAAGLARTDLMLANDGRAWVLEVNTVPGMTARSLAPQAARRAGLDLAALCDRLVRQALTTAGVA